MEIEQAIRQRRMLRALRPDPLPVEELHRLLDLARRAPSAGNTQAVEFVVLDRPETRALYWDCTLPPGIDAKTGRDRRAEFRWQGLLHAPVLVLIATSAQRYVARYAEADKARAGLGRDAEDWPVPYWFFDAGCVAQNLLLLATASGWGACLFGPFGHENELRSRLGLRDDHRITATIALGFPDDGEASGRSAGRPRPPLDSIIHRP